MSFNDQGVMNAIQYSMLEPPDGGQTWPSGLWTGAEVVGYLNQRQSTFLKNTHLQVGLANINVSQGVGEYSLPADWMNTVRVLWVPPTGTRYELTPSSVWEADHGIPTWGLVQGKPKIYFTENLPTLTIDIAPIPSTAGTMIIYYVPQPVELGGSGEIFTVPDEFVPSVKYGAMSDMLSKMGRAHDPSRASYCMQRYVLGQEIASMLLKGWKI